MLDIVPKNGFSIANLIIIIILALLGGYTFGISHVSAPSATKNSSTNKTQMLVLTIAVICIFLVATLAVYAKMKNIDIAPNSILGGISVFAICLTVFLIGYQQGIAKYADRKSASFKSLNNKLMIGIGASSVIFVGTLVAPLVKL